MELRVGRIMVSTHANGPGRRLVIWLQGCPFRCQGCFNPEFHDPSGGVRMQGLELMELILRYNSVEGVTFSGGEPFSQARALLPLAREIQRNGLSIVCYTGYTLRQIRTGVPPGGMRLLEFVDILIDGLYSKEEMAPLLWRGSRNQEVHFLSSRYAHLKERANSEGEQRAELLISSSSLAITGIFDVEFWEKLKAKLTSGTNPEGRTPP